MTETRLLVDPKLRAELEGDGLLDLDALIIRDDLHVIKARLESRQTYRLETSSGRTLYLKLYREVEPESRFARLFAQRFDSPASREWHVLNRLHELGVPTMHPAACIEELDGERVTRAALLTVGLNAPISLQKVLFEEFGEFPQPARRQALARELGRILRLMHDGGVNHRDFYFVHIRVGGDDKLYVTDLNRADIRKRVTRRWRVKDVAALLHSAPHAIVTATDKARFARGYFGSPLRNHRSFIEAAIRKAERMTSHTRKRLAQGEANYHVLD
jgi:heptose I phosphotransferase